MSNTATLEAYIATNCNNNTLPFLIADDIHYTAGLFVGFVFLIKLALRLPALQCRRQTRLKNALLALMAAFYAYDVAVTIFHVYPMYASASLASVSLSVGLLEFKGILFDSILGYFYYQVFFVLRDAKRLRHAVAFNTRILAAHLALNLLLIAAATALFAVYLNPNPDQRTAGLRYPLYISAASYLYHLLSIATMTLYIHRCLRSIDSSVPSVAAMFDKLVSCSAVYGLYGAARTAQQFGFVFDRNGVHRQVSFDFLRVVQYVLVYVCFTDALLVVFPSGFFLGKRKSVGAVVMTSVKGQKSSEGVSLDEGYEDM